MQRLQALSCGGPAAERAAPGDFQAVHTRINRLLIGIPALLLMLALKHHYSTAAADQLTWILAPTARLAAWLTHTQPVWESGVGYADYARGMIIAPACAGINFMIMAFGLATFCGLVRLGRLPALVLWLMLSLAGAYGFAIAVNALRISISLALYQAPVYGGWLTPDRLHRLAGVMLYLCALGLFFGWLQPIISRYCRCFEGKDHTVGRTLPSWLPLGWYLLGAVGVPTANLVFRSPEAGYGEHCITVLLTGLALVTASRLIKWVNGRYVKPRTAGFPGRERRRLENENGFDDSMTG